MQDIEYVSSNILSSKIYAIEGVSDIKDSCPGKYRFICIVYHRPYAVENGIRILQNPNQYAVNSLYTPKNYHIIGRMVGSFGNTGNEQLGHVSYFVKLN